MALRLEDKYVVHAKELGKGAWSVVRPCDVIPPYQPAALCAQPLAFGEGGEAAAGPSPAKADTAAEPSSPIAAAEVRLVAKVISKAHVQELAGGNPDRARADVMREVDTLRVLPAHPNVARFIEHLEDSESYYIIFEAAPGGDLCDLILAAPDSRIGESQAKQFTAEILRAVLHCHRHGTAHRDIKPENLLIGHGNVLKLTDFGLAKVLKPPAVPPTPDGKSSAAASPAAAAASAGSMPSPTTQSERQQFDFLAAAATADPVLAAMYPSRLWSEGEATSRPGCTLPASATGVGASASASAAASRPVSAPALAPFCPGHEIVGTLRYGAPEMFQAKFERGTFDAFQADAWSVGVVAYIMLTGNFPFSAGSNATERETYKVLVDTTVSPPSFLSAAAQDFLLRLLTKNPEKRMTLADALDHRWIRETVQKNDAAARDALHLRGRSTEPTAGDAAPLTAPPPVPLPPAMMRLRALVDDAARQLPSAEAAEVLRAAFDDSVDAFGSVAHATARLREQLLAKPAAAASSGAAAGSASSRLASGSAAGSARRTGVSSASPTGTRGASGSRPGTPSSASTAVRRPPSPAAVRRPLGTPTSASARATTPTGRPATPSARIPSPGRVGSATGSTTSTTGPRTLTPTRRAPGPAPTSASATASGIRRAPGATATAAGTAARRAESPTTAPKVATSTSSRTSSASRPVGGTSATATTSAAAPRVGVRNASPLARASPVARRGTPLRTAGGATTPTAASSTVARRAAPAPPGTSASATGGATSSARGAASSSSSALGTASAVLPEVGATAGYKGSKAIVRFVGETGFAAGKWVGLEMVEGREGIHDGTSAVDKRRYFTCPQGRGIFVRPSQVAAATSAASA